MQVNPFRVVAILFPVDLRLHGSDEGVPLLHHVAECGTFRFHLGVLVLELGQLVPEIRDLREGGGGREGGMEGG